MKSAISEISVIDKAISLCLSRGIPFYIYRLPGSEVIVFGAQTSVFVEEMGEIGAYIEEKGFLFSPFDILDSCPVYFLKGDYNLDTPDLLFKLSSIGKSVDWPLYKGEDITQEEYYEQVEHWIKLFETTDLRKAVLSRTRTIFCDGEKVALKIFDKMAARYPQAFVYMVYIPGKALWAGATPETFVRQNDDYLEVMSLAGTKKADDTTSWGQKDREEQQIVTEYIGEKFLSTFGKKPCLKGPFVRKAGTVSHLCTILRSEGRSPLNIVSSLVKELHPTPAVGGYPLNKAITLIKNTEKHERRYYAGYLGPVYGDGTFDLFVNLRCMEIFGNAVRIYVGGGITALSQPEAEWNETEIKSRTLLDVIGI